MRITVASKSRRSAVSASPLGWLVLMPVMLMGWTLQASVWAFVWGIKGIVWIYAVPFQLAWRGFQATRKRRVAHHAAY